LDDATVRHFVAAAYGHNHQLGLLIDVLATTGCRPSQVVRLTVGDLLIVDAAEPILRMPKSGKGGAVDRTARKAMRYSVPITAALGLLLRQEASGRDPDDFLLRQPNGDVWPDKNPSGQYRRDVTEIIRNIGLDPDTVTLYALRHSFVVRALLKNIPIRLVAALVDSSVSQIEATYSRHIAEHSDRIARSALLHPEPPSGVNAVVVPLTRAKGDSRQ
jgi:integrase